MHPSPFRHGAAPVRLPTGSSPTSSALGSAATTAAQRMDEWMDATQLMNVPLGEPLYSAVGDAEALQGLLPGPGPLARESLALPTRQSNSSLPARNSGQHADWTICGHPGADLFMSTHEGLLCVLTGTAALPCTQLALQTHVQQHCRVTHCMLQSCELTAVGSEVKADGGGAEHATTGPYLGYKLSCCKGQHVVMVHKLAMQ